MYSTVDTPMMIRTIVNHCSTIVNSSSSRNPTVVTVVTVWYTASVNDMPNTRYPRVPITITASTMATARWRRPIGL